jgi:hypothetical protein
VADRTKGTNLGEGNEEAHYEQQDDPEITRVALPSI